MMLKRGTLLLLVSAIALLGGVLLFEGNRSVTNEDTTQANDPSLPEGEQQQGELMFPFAEENVDTLRVERPADTVAFEKAEDGSWQMTAPETGDAEPGAIAFLLTQLTNPSANTLSVPADALSDFGLDSPTSTVDLTANGNAYQLTVGTTDFTGDQLYVQATEPDAEESDSPEVKIHLVSGGLDNAVNRPTQDWLTTENPEREESEPEEDESTPDETNSES